MIYKELGNTGIKVSALGFGCAAIGQDYASLPGVYGKDSRRLLRKAFAAGITFFDTAPTYGKSEKLLGEALGGEEVVLCTKVACGLGMTETHRRVMQSAKRLGRLDLLLYHNAPVDWISTAILRDEPPMGVSVYDADETEAALETGSWHCVQFPFNIFDQRHAFAFGNNKGVGTIAWSPLLRGELAKKFPPIQALRFSLFGGADVTLLGIRSEAELEAALEAVEAGPLDEDTLAAMKNMAVENLEIIDPRLWRKR